MSTEFTSDQLTPLNQLEAMLSEYAAQPSFNLETLNFSELWDLLEQSEQKLISHDSNSEGEVEFGLWLYTLNNNKNLSKLTTILRKYGMPDSVLDYDELQREMDLGGYIAHDGSLVSFSKYAVLDIGWLTSLYYYIKYKYIFPKKRHDFVANTKNPPAITSTDVTFAVLGDWGTGVWPDGKQADCPSQLVMQGIQNLKNNKGVPLVDYIVHLGDVYYAGTGKEETDNFINHFPSAYKDKFFTLNSNHEMYDGANGYFDKALGSPLLSSQNGTSYFAIEGEKWVIVCLDSGFYDESGLYMKGAITNNSDLKKHQINFLAQYTNCDKQLILMTHHTGINYSGTERNDKKHKGVLWDQVVNQALNGKTPDTWYWGHIHNAFVYNDNNAIVQASTSVNGGKPKFRCCGHAAIPFGKATHFDTNTMDYYAQTPMNATNPDETEKIRVLNGFATIRLTDTFMIETFYEVSNNYNGEPKAVWSLTTNFND